MYKNLTEESLLRDVWMKAVCTKLGRLAQGYNDVKGMETTRFVLSEKKYPTYQKIALSYVRESLLIITYRKKTPTTYKLR